MHTEPAIIVIYFMCTIALRMSSSTVWAAAMHSTKWKRYYLIINQIENAYGLLGTILKDFLWFHVYVKSISVRLFHKIVNYLAKKSDRVLSFYQPKTLNSSVLRVEVKFW